MKQQATTQTPKQTMPPQTKGLLPHTAVRVTSDHDLFANSPTESRFGHDFSQVAVRQSAPIVSRNYLNVSSPPRIQAKLKIGQPGDKYEQEADRVAEQVMRMPDPGLSSSVGGSSLVNGGNSGVGAGAIQAKTAGITTPEVTPAISSGIQSLQGGGRSLSGAERSFFEPRFGVDFSNVRLHSGSVAANAATAIGARAFTVGNHVAVAGGEYNFHSSQGKQLMAHELTHVLQNGNPDTIRRNPALAMGAAEWLGAAALGYAATQDAVASAAGDVSWKLATMSGVLLPGGRTDIDAYRTENPGLTVQFKELEIAFWRGHSDSRKAGIKLGLAFNTDGKGIGNVSARIIDPYDWVSWGAQCTVNLMPQTFVSANGKAVIRVTLTNSWSKYVGLSSGVDSEIWNLEGDGSFSRVRNDRWMWVEHSLT